MAEGSFIYTREGHVRHFAGGKGREKWGKLLKRKEKENRLRYSLLKDTDFSTRIAVDGDGSTEATGRSPEDEGSPRGDQTKQALTGTVRTPDASFEKRPDPSRKKKTNDAETGSGCVFSVDSYLVAVAVAVAARKWDGLRRRATTKTSEMLESWSTRSSLSSGEARAFTCFFIIRIPGETGHFRFASRGQGFDVSVFSVVVRRG